MKRYVVKSVPEKLVLAAIILSCGLVMQAPSAKQLNARYTGPLPRNYAPASIASHHVKISHVLARHARTAW
jgi:hypothetical protein